MFTDLKETEMITGTAKCSCRRPDVSTGLHSRDETCARLLDLVTEARQTSRVEASTVLGGHAPLFDSDGDAGFIVCSCTDEVGGNGIPGDLAAWWAHVQAQVSAGLSRCDGSCHDREEDCVRCGLLVDGDRVVGCDDCLSYAADDAEVAP